MTDEKQIYTDKEASNYLRVSQITLWRERKKGKISFRRVASKIVYLQEDLENYLNQKPVASLTLHEACLSQILLEGHWFICAKTSIVSKP